LIIGSVYHPPFGMSQCHGSTSHGVFNKLIAVGIPHMAALTLYDETRSRIWKLVVAFGIRVAASRDDGMRLKLQCF